ncbi:hypothetical protein Poli38472_005448 [Pythium oligandrum]|uniref:Uncharacterized protein n=1 Tax=Pythium oligandrum TaxID=41045 RepID=A0A8K1CGJ5_PYTOL|nr:hypothetical protein Poli38472_005448 [Pythium oligandrum]|eukprot:TMW62830.1 hypothetical protein Poli38472_005448 [Pythium oligandrum]
MLMLTGLKRATARTPGLYNAATLRLRTSQLLDRPLSTGRPLASTLFEGIHSENTRLGQPNDRASPLPGRLSAAPVLGVAAGRGSLVNGGVFARHSPVYYHQIRSYSQRRIPDWQRGSWVDTVKTGALLAVGASCALAVASVGFGLIVYGAAGYGVYTLYRKFIAPYRSPSSSNNPFGSIPSDIDRIFRDSRGRRDESSRSTSWMNSSNRSSKEIDSLVEGLPFVVRGLVKTVFSFVGRAMQDSMQRAGELRRLATEYAQANPRVVSQLGDRFNISTPQNWAEYTVNGAGRVEAVFPVEGGAYGRAQITAKANVGSGGDLQLKELKLRNLRTGEVIDLLRDAPSGPRKTVMEAEYVDVDDRR